MIDADIPPPSGFKKAAGIGGAISAAVLAIAIPFTAQNEGLRLKAYLDPAGIWTICNGETLNVTPGEQKTPQECQSMLSSRLGVFAWQVQSAVNHPIKPPMEAALADFAYNTGIEAFQRSTLLKKLNSGDSAGACDELLRWTTARGHVLTGLVRRRSAERKLCIEGI